MYFGVVLLIAAWALLGTVVRGPEPPTPRSLLLVLAVWAAPLLLAPPLFSRDVYSYLAQGAMVDAHIDVYAHGPAQLGGPLADEVAPVWQQSTTPYGPVFLAVASALSGLTRGELPAGLLGMRLVALLGVGLMAAALPRLARHSGADPAAALWLGALNPSSCCTWWPERTTTPSCSDCSAPDWWPRAAAGRSWASSSSPSRHWSRRPPRSACWR